MRTGTVLKDVEGWVFGQLRVIRRGFQKVRGFFPWVCRCSCGKEVLRSVSSLLEAPPNTSCGCYKKTAASLANKVHGATGSAEWKIWNGIRSRCLNKKDGAYPEYGGRGVAVHPDWLGPEGFARFLACVGKRPSSDHTIDRYPNGAGNYEPGNVRWATRVEQNSNTNRNRKVTYLGRTETLSQWGREFGIHRGVLRGRLDMGWSMQKALTAPVSHKRKK